MVSPDHTVSLMKSHGKRNYLSLNCVSFALCVEEVHVDMGKFSSKWHDAGKSSKAMGVDICFYVNFYVFRIVEFALISRFNLFFNNKLLFTMIEVLVAATWNCVNKLLAIPIILNVPCNESNYFINASSIGSCVLIFPKSIIQDKTQFPASPSSERRTKHAKLIYF